jgi:hypothetical protein
MEEKWEYAEADTQHSVHGFHLARVLFGREFVDWFTLLA